VIRLESRHDIAFPREAVWPILSKTDWLNRSVGLPAVHYEIQPRTEGGSTVTAHARVFGLETRWRELPFEWLEPEFYRVRRVFETGPFIEGRMGMELHEQPGGATRIVVCSELAPRNAFGRWVAKRLLGPKTERDMRRIAAHAEEFLRGRVKISFPRLPTHPVNEIALQTGLKKLLEAGHPADLVEQLEEFLRTSPDVELTHIRPLAVARQWGRDEWKVLALFLHSSHSGLLDFRWEILCPNCRSSRQPPVTSLSRLKRVTHCDVCQIQFDAEFDKSVELKFAVNQAIRPRDDQTFCLAGPGGKPHVLSQLWLEPLEERLWKMPKSTHPLRLRSPQVKQPLTVQPEDLPAPGQRLVISCDPARLHLDREPAGEGDGLARVRNPGPFPVLLSIEQTAWSDDILTAARITNWQEFRDLFSSEVISPAEQVMVGSQVILFTDLRGSTALYHGMGDAPAYALVRDHFSVLVEAIRAHRGTVVKTIGDAVMATFSRVDEALGAVRQMHQNIPAVNQAGGAPLALKSSLHVGTCLAVNANDKLDFFGTAINLAARMVECCRGCDLTVSDEFFHRPEMSDFLEGSHKKPEPSEVRFRGFDGPHRVWRIEMA
jgi:class 3 adenylate cyclase